MFKQMTDIMATTPDLTKLKHIIAQQLHIYYETLEDGTNVLRHIRVHQRTLQMPADGGVTVDIVTPEGKIATGKVDSASIEDDSVQLQGLTPEAREAMENHFATDDDVRSALGL